MAAWWTLAEEYANQEAKGKGKGKAKPEDLITDYRVRQDTPWTNINTQDRADLQNSIDLPSTLDVQIDLDVPRTISGQTQFVTRYGAGQRSLFHVLHCFSMRCHECEYVQGMGPIAATLLCYFEPEVSLLFTAEHELISSELMPCWSDYTTHMGCIQSSHLVSRGYWRRSTFKRD